MSVVERMVEAITNEDIDVYGRLYANEAVMYEPLLPEPARGRQGSCRVRLLSSPRSPM